ncbi:MAG: signal peptidase I [Lachnospiraceae bacterium]|nr:signal peptidase I [Lachnospiraceae bacterium]
MNKEIKEWLDSFRWAFIILIILYFVCWPVKVRGLSMEKTLKDSDRLLMSRAMSYIGAYGRGDIVILNLDLNGQNKDIVKRIIAMEGDSIRIKNGEVFLNGEKLYEPYALGETLGDVDIVVPEGCVYFLGDNRPESTDSRTLGTIPKSKVSGKILIRIYPFGKIE